MVDLSRIVSAVQIDGVRLCESHCRSLVGPTEIARSLAVNPSHDATVAREPGEDGLFLIKTSFFLEIRAEDGEEELQAEVQGVFELSYRVPNDEVFSSDELNKFGQVNAVFNAWPYWRELVQSSLARMSMPILTVPVYRVLPSDPDEDDGE